MLRAAGDLPLALHQSGNTMQFRNFQAPSSFGPLSDATSKQPSCGCFGRTEEQYGWNIAVSFDGAAPATPWRRADAGSLLCMSVVVSSRINTS